MRTLRQKADRKVWRIIKTRRDLQPEDVMPNGPRPASFPAIRNWMNCGRVLASTGSPNDSKTKPFEDAFYDFLDEFYLFQRVSFFEQEPPKEFKPETRAFLAATAEYLCRRFNLECPGWTRKPEYFLPKEIDLCGRPRRFGTPEYKQHGILFSSRGLMRL